MWVHDQYTGPVGAFARVLAMRHLCLHLAVSDLRARFRRSYLGIVWVVLQPLLLTTIMSVVLVNVFRQNFVDYSVYAYSGIIGWEFISGSFNLGATSLLGAESYLRQTRVPLIVLALKTTLHCLIVFLASLIGFAIYVAVVRPQSFSIQWLQLPGFFALAFAISLPLCAISSIVNVKVRDFQQAINLLLLAIWYVSPVFVAREFFNKEPLATFTYYNPAAAYMDYFRSLVMNGQVPELHTIVVLLAWTMLFWVVAIWLLRRSEESIIFYL